MNLARDEDFKNGKITNIREPDMTSVLGSVLKQNIKVYKTRSFKSLWETNTLQDEENDMVSLNVLVSENKMSIATSALCVFLLNSQWALSLADSLSTRQCVVVMLSFTTQNL